MRNRNSQVAEFGRRWKGMEVCQPKNLRWLPSALSYHYQHGEGQSVESEIIVLSLGIDQYLQEVFHNLDFDGKGRIYTDDFKRLCEVLGLRHDELRVNSPSTMSFKEFHARLCENFANKNEMGYIPFDCKVPKGEYLKTNIPMREEGECLKSRSMEEGKGRSLGSFPKKVSVYKKCRVDTIRPNSNWGSLDRHSQRSQEEVYQKVFRTGFHSNRSNCFGETSRTDGSHFLKCPENASAVKNAEREEAECLREIIEDLRAALQSSDARCLALQVALKKATKELESERADKNVRPKIRTKLSHNSHEMRPKHKIFDDDLEYAVQSRLNKNSKDTIEALSRRLSMVRESRDQEVTELIALVNQLQSELSETYLEKESLDERNIALMEQLWSIGTRYEGTRKLFEVALAKVRDLESQVRIIPELQEKIAFLLSEKDSTSKERSRKRSRSRGNKLDDVLAFIRRNRQPTRSTERKPPMGSSQDSIDSNEEGLFYRDVEGKSGSDEEYPQVEAIRPRSWMDEESTKVLKLQECLASLNGKLHQVSEEKRRLNEELQCSRLRNNETQKELENVEAERIRLFTMEVKLQDSINLMRFLRGKYLSRRTMGTFLLDVIDDSYGENPREEFVADKFVEKLLKKLMSSELLKAQSYQKIPFTNTPSELVPWSDFTEPSFRRHTEGSEQ